MTVFPAAVEIRGYHRGRSTELTLVCRIVFKWALKRSLLQINILLQFFLLVAADGWARTRDVMS